jgi:DNA-binding protein HU-beta
MTKAELQTALGEATQTDKRTAGVFLDTLSALAYKEIGKNGEFVVPGFGRLVKQKRKARIGFNPKTNRRSRFQPRPSSNFVCQGRGLAGKEVDLGVVSKILLPGNSESRKAR